MAMACDGLQPTSDGIQPTSDGLQLFSNYPHRRLRSLSSSLSRCPEA